MESDEELMTCIARGDERALGTLVERHAGPTHAHLVRMTGNRDDAEDLLQETWLRVARAARSFDPARTVRPWLLGIASNLARDLHRRRAVRRRAASEVPPVQQPAKDRRFETLALRERVGQLPDRLREVLWLRYYEDLDEAEMAEALGIPRGTVKSRLHGAIRELKRDWEDPS
jgi:RNA polymerase sigma-70 factor (ECF subfamily)